MNNISIIKNIFPKWESGDSILSNWAVKFDPVFHMPEYIQGVFTGTDDEILKHITNGTFIKIHDIQIYDYLNKFVETFDGKRFFLHGKGHQIIMIDNDVAMDIVMKKNNEVLD